MRIAVSNKRRREREAVHSQVANGYISAIVVPCSAQKSVEPLSIARAVSLPLSKQSALETAWARRLYDLPTTVAASCLYKGRGFVTARRATERARANLFIASAGLGLVRDEAAIPTYGLTVARVTGPDAIRGRVEGRFDPASWWRALQDGPYATAFDRCFVGEGLVIMALSHAYAHMLVEELAALSDTQVKRLRIVGMGLRPVLPERVRSASLLPYDDRLDGLSPGVRGEFCQRALSHFIGLIAGDGAGVRAGMDVAGHRALVEASLGPDRLGTPTRRSRATDEDIARYISARLISGHRKPGAAVLLRAIRDEDGIACEASRFARLYRLVARTTRPEAQQ